jgi:hypothetical protein
MSGVRVPRFRSVADGGRLPRTLYLAVFKTVCGALLRRPGWVRFPSIPAASLSAASRPRPALDNSVLSRSSRLSMGWTSIVARRRLHRADPELQWDSQGFGQHPGYSSGPEMLGSLPRADATSTFTGAGGRPAERCRYDRSDRLGSHGPVPTGPAPPVS